MMKVILITDKPPFFRSVRIGNWLHIYDYETGEGRWEWEGPTLSPKQERFRQIFSDAGRRRQAKLRGDALL